VITVPAYFKEPQKKATEQAALLAGLYPRLLIPEPTAAAICYGVDRDDPGLKKYLVFDLGGGTFDVTVITVEGTSIEVVATAGNSRLGGGDFDDLITEWALDRLKADYGLDVRDSPLKRAMIKFYAERLKRALSTNAAEKLILAELRPAAPPILELKQTEFEGMIKPLLQQKAIPCVELALEEARGKAIRREDISAILLVGGSSRIPLVRGMLLDYFGKGESFVRSDLDPDLVVARGAGMLALSFEPTSPPFDINKKIVGGRNVGAEQLIDPVLITEHSLGVGVQDNKFHKIIGKGAKLPTSITDSNFSNQGPTNKIEVRVYQGEGDYVFQNSLIGVLELGPIEEKPQGHHKFEVTFSLDENGLLSMIVHHVNEGRKWPKTFENRIDLGGLQTLRESLVMLFSEAIKVSNTVSTESPVTQPPLPTGAPPSSAMPPQPLPQGVPPAPAPPQTSAATISPVSSEPVAPVAATSGAPPAAQAAPELPPAASAAAPTGAASTVELLEPSVPVPEKHKQLVRKVMKQLLRLHNDDLAVAQNALIQAINSGRPESERDALHNELTDAYIDATI